jgi:predicted RND superfamily exporter protein
MRKTPFELWTEFLLRYRWLVVLATGALTLSMGYLASGLTTNNDYETWLPSHDRVALLYRETDREFSSNALLFICLEFDQHGVFHPDSLREIRRLTSLFEGRPEVFHVMSLTNVFDIRATNEGLEVRKLVQDIPSERVELERLSAYVLSKEMYLNTLVSADAKYAALLLNIRGTYDEIEVAGTLLELLEREARGLRYYFGGDPALAHYIDLYMARDMKTLVPLAVIVIAVVLAFGLRSYASVALPLAVVALSIVWTLGLQRVFNMPMNLMTPAALVLLVAMGSDYAVHTMNHCLRSGELDHSGGEITLPILMSALTTIAGLATFATTRIKVLSDFGFVLAFGLAAACAISVTVLIALLRIFSVRPATSPSSPARPPEADHLYSRLLEKSTLFILRHHRPFLAAVLLACAGVGIGIARIHTEVDIVSMLPEDSPPRRGHDILNEHFGGIYPLSIYSRGDHQEPSVLMLQLSLENYMRSNPSLSGFTSIAGLIAEMNFLLTGVYAVPETREGVANLWILLEGEPSLDLFVNEARDKALLNARIKGSDMSTMRALAEFLRRRIPPETREEMVTLSLASVPEGKRALLRASLFRAAAEELSLLAHAYGGGALVPVDSLLRAIETAWPQAQQIRATEKVWEELGRYLREQGLDPATNAGHADYLGRFKRLFVQDPSGAWLSDSADALSKEASIEPEEARSLSEVALFRCLEILRKERTEALLESVLEAVPVSLALASKPEFTKRARGLLWALFSETPVLPASRLPHDPDLARAIMSRVPVTLDQAGAPDVFRRFDELLIQSQIQSLALAILMVLALVSLLHRSLTRGLLSVLAILLPLVIMLGLMGWAGIPLNFGTVLVGALIVGLGIDGSIHIIYFESLNVRRLDPPERALVKSIRHVGRAVLTANSTTVAGFLVTLLSSSRTLRQFSSVNAFAIVLVTASVFTVLPALLKATGSLSGGTRRNGPSAS